MKLFIAAKNITLDSGHTITGDNEMQPNHVVKIEENTFSFFVKSGKVIIKQFTDFTGTILEDDFPEGDTTIWEVGIGKDFTEKQALNQAGFKILKDWVAV